MYFSDTVLVCFDQYGSYAGLYILLKQFKLSSAGRKSSYRELIFFINLSKCSSGLWKLALHGKSLLMFELVLFISNQNNYLCVELVLSKTLFIFIINITLGIISDWPIHRKFCLSYPIRWQLMIVALHLTGFQPNYQYKMNKFFACL